MVIPSLFLIASGLLILGTEGQKTTCKHNGIDYDEGYKLIRNCYQCVCFDGEFTHCTPICIGKRGLSFEDTILGQLIKFRRSVRRYNTPPIPTTTTIATTESPPPFTTRTPGPPPTTEGPTSPKTYTTKFVTHAKTRSPPPPGSYVG